MLDAAREWFGYDLPWWIWVAPSVGGAIALFLVASRLIGWRNALLAVAAYAVAAVAILSRLRGRQEGWEDRARKDARDAEKLVERIKKARDDARTRPADKLRDDDGFKRP